MLEPVPLRRTVGAVWCPGQRRSGGCGGVTPAGRAASVWTVVFQAFSVCIPHGQNPGSVNQVVGVICVTVCLARVTVVVPGRLSLTGCQLSYCMTVSAGVALAEWLRTSCPPPACSADISALSVRAAPGGRSWTAPASQVGALVRGRVPPEHTHTCVLTAFAPSLPRSRKPSPWALLRSLA